MPDGVVNVLPTSRPGPLVVGDAGRPAGAQAVVHRVDRGRPGAAADRGRHRHQLLDGARRQRAVPGLRRRRHRRRRRRGVPGQDAQRRARRAPRPTGSTCTRRSPTSSAPKFAQRLARCGSARAWTTATELGPLVNADTRTKVASLVDDGDQRRRPGGHRRPGARPARLLLRSRRCSTTSRPTRASCTRRSSGRSRRSSGSPTPTRRSRWPTAPSTAWCPTSTPRDLRRGLQVAEALEAGMVGINRGVVSDPAAPFGGVKQSGHRPRGRPRRAAGVHRDQVHRRGLVSRLAWTGEYSGWRTSTASPARSAGSGGCPRTRWPGTCSAGWSRGAAAATCSCATAPGSTWTSAAIRSTRRPECDSLIDLVTHDKAGERILEGLLVDADRRLREEGIAGDIYLFKNNTDSAGNSYGCHENYLVGRHGEFGRLADILIPFLVTRQIICGAGKVLQTPRGAVYCVSQRAEHIWEGVSSATTRSRPIINTRDEPHADAERFRRLHVIVGRLEHERDHHAAQGRRDRPGAADGRGGHRDARPDAGEPDPGDQGRQPRHDRAAQDPAGQRARGQRPGDPAGVPVQGQGVRRPQGRGPDHRAGARAVGADAARGARPATSAWWRGRSTG